IYYLDEEDIPVIKEKMDQVGEKYREPIVTELEPLRSYFSAEEYHQDYLKKNPGGYCHVDMSL
ncbi:MAG TPA: peptide-methionine (S)-S-oxide reductase, partial [Tissierellaceae bacterium]|nr:peptide-methionine (S)-S-oxide reductase [Tissierellaceae bacterium]